MLKKSKAVEIKLASFRALIKKSHYLIWKNRMAKRSLFLKDFYGCLTFLGKVFSSIFFPFTFSLVSGKFKCLKLFEK